MPEGVCGYDGKTYIVGLRCEVENRCDCCGSVLVCDKPTTHFYPAMGGGTMPLCAEHAQKHLPYCAWPVAPTDGGGANG